MHGAHGSLEFVHWLGTAVLAASILVQIIPTPQEIPGRFYLVLFNTVRRVANLKMNAEWKDQVIVPVKTETVATVKQTETVGERRPDPNPPTKEGG